ncbi:flagellar hook-length control protein FliK [uncultured Pseudoalteromonas sp.]|uniref:flagellar hook-length control protein FliK n=1 Tax=uncultured Pseudoalteromonas sp. TaxID=114053 RepID=UPI0025E58666|nr:flagellar hook-length control protein FliK [uncultured Pseudoalteromonas sp.]|tara:strand:- start:9186 stop:11399 length:2214 start_codon:yes stop_codon:yes gene_type:complete
MAISDINLQVKTEQGTGFSSKETESYDTASGLRFLTSLTEASEAANAQTTSQSKNDNEYYRLEKSEQESEELTVDTDYDHESATADVSDSKKNTSETVTKEQDESQTDSSLNEENSLLSQINAAQAMSTRVNKLIEDNELGDDVTAKKPVSGDSVTPIIPSPMNSMSDADKSAGNSDINNTAASVLHKSKVATAVDNQLKAGTEIPQKDAKTSDSDSPLIDKKLTVSAADTPNTVPQQSESAKETKANLSEKNSLNSLLKATGEADAQKPTSAQLAAQNNQASVASSVVAEVTNAKTVSSTEQNLDSPKVNQGIENSVTDKSIISLFAKVQSGDGKAVSEFAKGLSLTHEQQQQLEQQINQLKTDHKLDSKDAETIKNLLTELMNKTTPLQVTQNQASQLTADESQIQQDVKLPEQKASDFKLPVGVEKQLAALTKDEQQAMLNKVNAQLQTVTAGTSQFEKLTAAKAWLSEAVNTNGKTNLTTPVTTANASAVENSNTTPTRAEKLAPAVGNVNNSEESSAERDIKLNAERSQEVSTPRVTQLLNQLTSPVATSIQPTAHDIAQHHHENAIDAHIMQTQTTQQAQSKSVSVDPGVMQAINIIKSDAAKMLQERVSALLNINNKEAEIRLDPPEMGSMQIRIRSDAEQAQINFVVQNQQAKEALEQSMPRLREMLAQQGIELGESSIQQGSPEQQDGEPGQGQLAGNQHNEEQQQEVTAQSAETSRQQSSSSIDYYA